MIPIIDKSGGHRHTLLTDVTTQLITVWGRPGRVRIKWYDLDTDRAASVQELGRVGHYYWVHCSDGYGRRVVWHFLVIVFVPVVGPSDVRTGVLHSNDVFR